MGPFADEVFKFADGKTLNAAAKLHIWLDPSPTANEELVSNIMV